MQDAQDVRTIGKRATLDELVEVANLSKSKALRNVYEENLKTVIENGEIKTVFLSESGPYIGKVKELLREALAMDYDCSIRLQEIPEDISDQQLGTTIVSLYNDRMKLFNVLNPLVTKYNEIKKILNFLETSYSVVSFADTQWRATSEFNILLRDVVSQFLTLESRISALRMKLEFMDTAFSILSRLIAIRQLTVGGVTPPIEMGVTFPKEVPLSSPQSGNISIRASISQPEAG